MRQRIPRNLSQAPGTVRLRETRYVVVATYWIRANRSNFESQISFLASPNTMEPAKLTRQLSDSSDVPAAKRLRRKSVSFNSKVGDAMAAAASSGSEDHVSTCQPTPASGHEGSPSSLSYQDFSRSGLPVIADGYSPQSVASWGHPTPHLGSDISIGSAQRESVYDDEIDEEVEEIDGDFGDDGEELGTGYEDGSGSGLSSGAMMPRHRFSRDFCDWEVGTRYTMVRVLGHGSYGEVAEAIDNEDGGRKVAIKRILNIFDQDVDAKRIYREMYILRYFRHKEVIRLLDVVSPKDYDSFKDLYLVFEYVDTDLYKLILSPQYLTNAHIQMLMYQMLLGLKYLHGAHVIHRDIKPANILINENCTVKVCDFGLSRVVGPEHISRGTCECPNTPERTRGAAGGSNGHLPAQVHEQGCSHGANEALAAAKRKSDEMAILNMGGRMNGRGGSTEGGSSAASEGDASQSDDGTHWPGAPQHRVLKRQLTRHVVTRWYRAPELILLQDYTSAVDLWSLGCIFAELLSMQQESVERYQDRMPLFPGKSCFPLSADAPTTYNEKLDQLNVIFDVIGTPCETDIEALGEVRQYLVLLPTKKARPFSEVYKGASPSALGLLRRMLQFNPARRITVDQALDHEYLRGVRRIDNEQPPVPPIVMDTEDLTMDNEDLKRAVYAEVCKYQKPARASHAGVYTQTAAEQHYSAVYRN